MAKSVKSDTQTKTALSQTVHFRGHMYTMAAAFAGVIFGVLGSMGFVGNYLNSQFAAQTAALDKRLVSVQPAAVTTADACYGETSASAAPGKASAKAGPTESHAVAANPVVPAAPVTPGATTPFVHQMINGSISNTGPNSVATINASNNFTSTTTNTNVVGVNNSNTQSSSSGSASSSTNTGAGATTSGSSSNDNSSSTVIGIDN